MAVPKLRFKEFDGDWKSDKVGKFLIEYKQKVPSSTDIEIYSSSRNGLKPQKEYFDNRELQNFGEYGVVPPNYLTYRHMSDDTTFKFNINLIGKKIAVSKEYPVFTTNEFMDSSFLLFKLNESNDFKKFAIEQKKGGTRTRLYFKALCTWKTLLPTKAEQTKIASFLSAVDEKINQLTQKHQLLSQYKQGMMKKLFSQQIRFKADDGSEFGEWEEKTIGEIGEVVTGKTPSTTNSNAWNGNVLFVTPTDMKGNKYQNTTIRTVANKQPKVLPQNTIMFTCIASIGKMALSVKPSITNQQINSIIVKNDHPEFIYYQLLNMVDYIKSTQANTTLPIINKTEFSKFFLRIPQQAEQTKIANFLSAIDQKINVVSGQIEQAKLWKKGLLQQMFV